MEVQEHLVAHLEKEVELYRFRSLDAPDQDIEDSLYEMTNPKHNHVTGIVEDSVIAGLLDSLRLSEPLFIAHLDRVKLFHGSSGWTLQSLETCLRAYEQDLNAHPPLD
ncbi:hypothetical protein BWQ96_06087 [Gracilariopsis chorda]|uniref:Uncharacterized protein n=1 Tax=Gracilariopsis chorda TaxID=448386 RepID=A0A2V3ISS7_9FLOR|nr:hypothetical protein BWQ96_06087 [Gracilariopsis chorda]|eukprot:PXF44160.1 hypothetical protein BWQ96_06087 [Gracilariopsis chorda]